LFAVLIHKGTANSGHYYSFIKDVEDEEWYKFNDASVSWIDFLEIVKAFGEKGSLKNRKNQAYEVGENAYMLLYRERNETNINVVPDECIGEVLRKEIEHDYNSEQIALIEKEAKA